MSVKTRIIRAGVLYAVKNPTARVTVFAARFLLRRLRRKAVASLPAPPASRTSGVRIVLALGIGAGALWFVRRRARGKDLPASSSVVPATASPEPIVVPVPPFATAAADAAATDLGDDDAALATRVERELFDGAPAVGISVEAAAGVVTLRGQVANPDAEVRVIRDAEAVEGVKAVQSELETAEAGTDPAA